MNMKPIRLAREGDGMTEYIAVDNIKVGDILVVDEQVEKEYCADPLNGCKCVGGKHKSPPHPKTAELPEGLATLLEDEFSFDRSNIAKNRKAINQIIKYLKHQKK